MKKLFILCSISVLLLITGCSTVSESSLKENVGKKDNFINHYNKPYFEVTTSEDIEDVVVYLPKSTTTVRLKMKVSNLEDIIYMKLVTEDGYEIDKVLRRVEDIKSLGYEQDGYMYEPSVEKNVVTLQLYIPNIYLYNGVYKPTLVFSFKRNARSVQEIVKLYFAKQMYTVSTDNNLSEEKPAYMTLSDYCEKSNRAGDDFFTQINRVNENRIDLDLIKEIESSCR